GFEESDLLFSEWANLGTTNKDGSDGDALAQQRSAKCRPNSYELDVMPDVRVGVLTLGQHVMNVDCLPVDYGAAAHGSTADRSSFANRKCRGISPMAGHFLHYVTLKPIDLSIMGVAQARGAHGNCVHHGLQVSG